MDDSTQQGDSGVVFSYISERLRPCEAVNRIADELKISKASESVSFPYSSVSYKLEEQSRNVRRCERYHTDFIRYHLHFSDSHCPDRLRRLVNEDRIVQCLNDMERKVSEAIFRQVELWKQTDSCYQKAVLSGDAEQMLGLENCFISMAREAVFACIVYI